MQKKLTKQTNKRSLIFFWFCTWILNIKSRKFEFLMFRNWIFKQFIFQFFSISFRNDKLLINVNTIYFCNENDRNECENKKKNQNKKQKNMKMKKEISTKIFKLMQKTLNILYNNLFDFSNNFLLKTMRNDFTNIYWFQFFDFEFFEFWLINDFLLIANLK